MSKSATEELLENNRRYASGTSIHRPEHPGPQPIRPSRRVAVVACMDARLDVEDLLGLQTGEAHIIRNAGGIVAEDTIRSLVISHHLLDTREIILIHHTRCGMLAFTDDLLKAGLEVEDVWMERRIRHTTVEAYVERMRASLFTADTRACALPVEPSMPWPLS